MMTTSRSKPPPHLVLTAVLSGSLTAVLSIIYTVLCIIALICRSRCDLGDPDTTTGSQFFINVLYRLYFQEHNVCIHSLEWEGLTHADTVYVMTWITLAASVLCLAASIALVSSVNNDRMARHLGVIVSTHVGISLISLVVDIILATHFGRDYAYMTNELEASSPGLAMSYLRDTIRLGAFLLMVVAAKGLAPLAVNAVLLVLLVYLLIQHDSSRGTTHPIYTLGPLSAYSDIGRNDTGVTKTSNPATPANNRNNDVDNYFGQEHTWTTRNNDIGRNDTGVTKTSNPATPANNRNNDVDNYFGQEHTWTTRNNRMFEVRPESWSQSPMPERPRLADNLPSAIRPPAMPPPDYDLRPHRMPWTRQQ